MILQSVKLPVICHTGGLKTNLVCQRGKALLVHASVRLSRADTGFAAPRVSHVSD